MELSVGPGSDCARGSRSLWNEGVEGAELEAQQVKYRRGESAAAMFQDLRDLNSCSEFYHPNVTCVGCIQNGV